MLRPQGDSHSIKLFGPATTILANILNPVSWVNTLIRMNSLLFSFIFASSAPTSLRFMTTHIHLVPAASYFPDILFFSYLYYCFSNHWDVLKHDSGFSLDAIGGGGFQENSNILLDTCFR